MLHNSIAEVVFEYDKFCAGFKNNFTKISKARFYEIDNKLVPDFEVRVIELAVRISKAHYFYILDRAVNSLPVPEVVLYDFDVYLFSEYGKNKFNNARKKVKDKISPIIEAHQIVDVSIR